MYITESKSDVNLCESGIDSFFVLLNVKRIIFIKLIKKAIEKKICDLESIRIRKCFLISYMSHQFCNFYNQKCNIGEIISPNQ